MFHKTNVLTSTKASKTMYCLTVIAIWLPFNFFWNLQVFLSLILGNSSHLTCWLEKAWGVCFWIKTEILEWKIICIGIDGGKGFRKIKAAGKASIDRANSVNKERNGKAFSVRLEQQIRIRVWKALNCQSRTGVMIWKSVSVNKHRENAIFNIYAYENDSEMSKNDTNNGTKTGEWMKLG